MPLDANDIRERLRRLGALDAARRVFGAIGHNYVLNPPLDKSILNAFEQQHGISLPDDYRQFLTQIGNGGAGPAYGLFPFGHDDVGRWEDTMLLGDVGQPFAYSEPWNLSDEFWKSEPRIDEGMSPEDEDRLWEEWDRRENEAYWNPALMNGAIPICHIGCALRQWLVVHGPQHGYVWDDRRVDHAGLSPALDVDGKPLTFAAWYLSWLANAERIVDRPINVAPTRFAKPASWSRELLELLLLVIAGVILALVLAYLRR